MHPIVKHRKHISRFAIAAVIVIILFTTATFILSYRIKEIAEQIVNQQTQGQYVLTMKKLHLSLWRGRAELENAQVTHFDSVASRRFIVRLPAIYFQLSSWKALLFEKKLSIDSVMLSRPTFEVFEESTDTQQRKIIFQTVRIFEGINRAVDIFNVRSLHLGDGSFIYHADNVTHPFESHRINISIRNFARDSNNLHRFMSADEVEISIGRQDWKLADSNQEIKFSKFRFSGKKQSFELDSFRFSSRAASNQSDLMLSIDTLTFASEQLPAFYENNQLLIDTLRCIHPMLRLQFNKDTSSIDTSSVISESLKSIFANIHVKFLDIDKGQFTVDEKANGRSSHYSTEKTNLKIDNLDIRPNESPFLSTGNIDLKLNQLHFYTPDSLYQLTVDEFDLYNEGLRFKNAFFSPAYNNHNSESFFITIPVLVLKNLDLKKLLERRLVADMAQMDYPVVTIQSIGERKNNKKLVTGNSSGFYEGLQGLSELMQVRLLSIKNGTVNYKSLSDSSIHAKVSGFNVSVLLNDFLQSNSLQDIKHSIPYLQAAEITFHSQAVTAVVNQIGLFDTIHHNMIDKIELTLANGITLKGEKILWRKLNWDELKNRNAIVADSINIDELTFTDEQGTINKSAVVRDLPVISVRKLGINEFKIHYALSESEVEAKAKGKNILFTDVSTLKDKLLWRNAKGVFTNFEYQSSAVNASSDKIKFETPGKTRFSGIQLKMDNGQGTIHVRIHEADFESTIASTDFTSFEFPMVVINEPLIKVVQTQSMDSKTKPFKVPFNFIVGSMNINGGQIIYNLNKESDSLQFSSVVNASIDSLIVIRNQPEYLRFGKMNIALDKIMAHNNKFDVAIPSMEFIASNASISDLDGKTILRSLVAGNWNHASIDMLAKKGSKIDLTNFSGTLAESKLDLTTGRKFQWKEWMNRLNIQSGSLQFSDSIRDISFSNLTWNTSKEELQVDSILLQPKLTPTEYFSKALWQSDYISVSGGPLIVSGIEFDKWQNDSIFRANRISFDNANVNVWRDKRIPFRHGIEKMMPARLINSIGYQFNIDSVVVKNSDVTYHELSSITNREGIVPFENIDATMQHFGNYHSENNDTLTIRGKAKFLNSPIKKFRYAEAYNDSLGSFKLSLKVSPGQLNEFSKISNPLAAVNINDGILDTMVVRISGNKYAAIGEMNCYYHDLKVNFIDHEDAAQKRIALSFVNFVANRFVIKSKNRKQSRIFYIRDRERFVFNYWIKSIMSGMLTSAGVRSNGAYDKEYQKLKDQYALPELNF